MNALLIDVRPPDEEARQLWEKVAELAQEFGIDQNWCLVGGLMVQLHGFEHAANPRPTSDIDILADSRRRPSMTRQLAETLDELGAKLAQTRRPPSQTSAISSRLTIRLWRFSGPMV